MRVVLIVVGIVLGGLTGLLLGMASAEVVVTALGSLDEYEYLLIKLLGPLVAAAVAAGAGGVAGARLARE